MNNKIFITSDLHINHSNLCSGTSKWPSLKGTRNFKTLDDMNNSIINSINKVVKRDDILYSLGDILMGQKNKFNEFLDRINCNNIYHIFGNHCNFIRNNEELKKRFKWCGDYLEVKINGKLFIMSHYAMRVWNKSHHGSFHCYGHSHHTLPEYGRSMDVGWCKYRRPLSIEEVINILSKRNIEFVDHHNRETNE